MQGFKHHRVKDGIIEAPPPLGVKPLRFALLPDRRKILDRSLIWGGKRTSGQEQGKNPYVLRHCDSLVNRLLNMTFNHEGMIIIQPKQAYGLKFHVQAGFKH
jgi:hypothetical protein